MEVELRHERNPRVENPERVEVTAYYVIAEALTNVAKHAGAGRVGTDSGTGSGTAGKAPTALAGLILRHDPRGDSQGLRGE